MLDVKMGDCLVYCACENAILIGDREECFEISNLSGTACERFVFAKIMHELDFKHFLSVADYQIKRDKILANKAAHESAVVQQAQAWFDAH